MLRRDKLHSSHLPPHAFSMWEAISNIGDAALTLPVALACAAWAFASNRRLAFRWMLCLAAGMALVGATKILYAGCGIEARQLDFRVISGHTMLSTSVWSVAFAMLFQSIGRNRWIGAAIGLLVGAITGVARVFDHAHTAPEVVIGWLTGALVVYVVLQWRWNAAWHLRSPKIAAAALLLVSSVAYGHRAPIQHVIDTRSPQICELVRSAVSGVF
jgi:membrane-associated phospholipid phosphatase